MDLDKDDDDDDDDHNFFIYPLTHSYDLLL